MLNYTDILKNYKPYLLEYCKSGIRKLIRLLKQWHPIKHDAEANVFEYRNHKIMLVCILFTCSQMRRCSEFHLWNECYVHSLCPVFAGWLQFQSNSWLLFQTALELLENIFFSLLTELDCLLSLCFQSLCKAKPGMSHWYWYQSSHLPLGKTANNYISQNIGLFL